MPHKVINGYRAEILNDYGAYVSVNGGDCANWITYPNIPARVTPFWMKGAIAFAEAHGANRICITRSIYARYKLRSVMKSVSGTYTTFTDYTRNENGKWIRTVRIKNEMY